MISISLLQDDFLSSKSVDDRKILGQFFTGSVLSNYMASLVNLHNTSHIRLLDAGAGAGILTASTAKHCLESGCKSVHAVLYELDSHLVSHLDKTMGIVKALFKRNNAIFTYEIKNEDFVLARPDKDQSIIPFDAAVINPPYFKYNVKASPYAKIASDLYKGDPNIYASFMAVVLSCLNEHGNMVSITPRSFTNGLYFKGFRQYLLNESSLDLVHIFKSRNKVFCDKNSSVLQENIICRFVKGDTIKRITIRASSCDESISSAEEHSYPTALIIDPSNDQKIIRIPESKYDAHILEQAEKLPTTFDGAGYFISTGPVVEHRAREYITSKACTKCVPLYRPHNVTPFTSSWTGDHKKDVSFKLSSGHEKYMVNNSTYVLLKRFSSKDEKRRLVSSAYLANSSENKLIGFGNKLNYIGLKKGKLTIAEAYGLAAIFNSTFMDKYFRCISGNTQVNATEIRVLKFPVRETVKKIGTLVQRQKLTRKEDVDEIISSVLDVQGL